MNSVKQRENKTPMNPFSLSLKTIINEEKTFEQKRNELSESKLKENAKHTKKKRMFI